MENFQDFISIFLPYISSLCPSVRKYSRVRPTLLSATISQTVRNYQNLEHIECSETSRRVLKPPGSSENHKILNIFTRDSIFGYRKNLRLKIISET